MNGREVLTNPGAPKRPGSLVNKDDDLIVCRGDLLDTSSSGIRYRVTGTLGSGTFGQVFECAVLDDADNEGSAGSARDADASTSTAASASASAPHQRAAVKVIKNQAAYYHQARVEIGVLQMLNTQVDPHDRYHIVRLRDFFMFKGHLCLVFELLGLNLYELIRRNKFRGLSLSLVRVFVTHVLKALAVLKDSSVIHCDVKPENILLEDPKTGRVKLIDFGSACFRNKAVYTYIQSRFYRAPEVVIGYGYTEAVDMWSVGCVAAELFLGLPLFPASSEFDLLERIAETIGPLPRSMLIKSKNTGVFYTFEDSDTHRGARLLTTEEYQTLNMRSAVRGKKYFKHTLLRDIIDNAPFKAGLSEAEREAQVGQREQFLDFLEGLLQCDPSCRMTPREALRHAFITGQTRRSEEGADAQAEKAKERIAKERIPPPAAPMAVPRSSHASKASRLGMHARTTTVAHSGGSGGSGRSGGAMSYTPAGSIARIGMVGTSLASESVMPTPPSRSLGARMHVAPPEPTAPMPAPSGDGRVMPIMSIPGGGSAEGSSSCGAGGGVFVPSSVRTYRGWLGGLDGNDDGSGRYSLGREESIQEQETGSDDDDGSPSENDGGHDDEDDIDLDGLRI